MFTGGELREESGPAPRASRRQLIRNFAAALSGVTAIIYFLIGFNLISVIDTPADQGFGIPAAVAYVVGTVLLIAYDRRVLWILGAALQVFVIAMYFDKSTQRTPSFESWGIMLRIIQFVLLSLLTYLAVRLRRESLAATDMKVR